MKFPVVTVVLVSAALIYLVWDQTREQPGPVDPGSFTNLPANPAKRSDVVELAITQIPEVCAQAVGRDGGADAGAECEKRAESRTSTCRRAVYDTFPDNVSSEAVFRDLSITMMNCLVPQSGLVRP